jgi:hypothetical protein
MRLQRVSANIWPEIAPRRTTCPRNAVSDQETLSIIVSLDSNIETQ